MPHNERKQMTIYCAEPEIWEQFKGMHDSGSAALLELMRTTVEGGEPVLAAVSMEDAAALLLEHEEACVDMHEAVIGGRSTKARQAKLDRLLKRLLAALTGTTPTAKAVRAAHVT